MTRKTRRGRVRNRRVSDTICQVTKVHQVLQINYWQYLRRIVLHNRYDADTTVNGVNAPIKRLLYGGPNFYTIVYRQVASLRAAVRAPADLSCLFSTGSAGSGRRGAWSRAPTDCLPSSSTRWRRSASSAWPYRARRRRNTASRCRRALTDRPTPARRDAAAQHKLDVVTISTFFDGAWRHFVIIACARLLLLLLRLVLVVRAR